jgi:predicted membrane-bound spermidine synthase
VIGAVLGEKIPLSMHVYGPQAPRLTTEDDVMKGVKSLDMLVRFCVEMGYDFVFIYSRCLTCPALSTKPLTSAL